MEQPKVKQIANLTKFIHKMSSKRENPNRYRLYDITGISPTISCMGGGGLEPLILLEMKDEAKINIVGKWSPNSESNGNVYDAATVQNFRIRKLTERECFRLMGVRDADIDKIKAAGISKTQMYKLAGNSIVCDVLMAIFDKMFVNTNAEKGQQLSLF